MTEAIDAALAGPLTAAARKEFLNALFGKLSDPRNFSDLFPAVEGEMLRFLQAERVTIYQKSQKDREIISRYRGEDDTLHEIRLSLTPSSIAGFVAMSHKALCIPDVYDAKYLAAIHPELTFDSAFDKRSGFRTASMMAVPIKSGDVLLGVLQVINRAGGGAFAREEFTNAQELARVLAHKFRGEMHGTRGPFDALVESGRLPMDKLEELHKRAEQLKMPVTMLMQKELSISPDEIGDSLSRHFQVAFMRYDPAIRLPEEFMKNLPIPYLERAMWVPVAGNGKRAVILMDQPSDAARVMEAQRRVKAETYEFRVGLPEDILRFLGREPGPAVRAQVIGEESEEVVALVQGLLDDGYRQGAVDVVIEPVPGGQEAAAKFRVEGVLKPIRAIPASHVKAMMKRIKGLANLEIADSSRPQSGSCRLELAGQNVEIRVTTTPTLQGESASVRILVPPKQRVV